ncbi:MAG: hypothetical protein KGL46_12055 [Hyphomicrobiales bacterium]|nr:hypothetical protein [Hyphomicrobiales bacterium]
MNKQSMLAAAAVSAAFLFLAGCSWRQAEVNIEAAAGKAAALAGQTRAAACAHYLDLHAAFAVLAPDLPAAEVKREAALKAALDAACAGNGSLAQLAQAWAAYSAMMRASPAP